MWCCAYGSATSARIYYDIKSKISRALLWVCVCVCEPCARFGEGSSDSIPFVRSCYYYNNFQLSRSILLGFEWQMMLNSSMSKSDGYFTQEIVFSIRTELEIYVRAMAAAEHTIHISCERDDQPSATRTRAEEWKKKSMRMWNSGRLCELWTTMMAHSRALDAQTDSYCRCWCQPTFALCRVDFYKLHIFFAPSLLNQITPDRFVEIFGERNARALDCKSNFLRRIGKKFLLFSVFPCWMWMYHIYILPSTMGYIITL